jgi:predicted PurR-regulated permease PerM
MQPIPGHIIRQVFFLILIFLLGILLFLQLRTFVPAFLGAYTLYVLLRNPMMRLQTRYKWGKAASASLLMLMSFIIILLPVFLTVNMVMGKFNFAVVHVTEVLSSIERFVHVYEEKYGIDVFTQDNVTSFTSWFARSLPSLLGATMQTLLSILIMYFILYFMLTQPPLMEGIMRRLAPLSKHSMVKLQGEVNEMVFSNAVGIPLIALLQALVALIGYWVIGVKEPLFWFVITFVAALLPVIGSAFAYVPISLLFFAEGQSTKGIILLLFGLLIVGTVDNIFRMWLQKKIGDVHPLITIFGVIIGINLFGFIGLIFGPILISLFIILLKLYSSEFMSSTDSEG